MGLSRAIVRSFNLLVCDEKLHVLIVFRAKLFTYITHTADEYCSFLWIMRLLYTLTY